MSTKTTYPINNAPIGGLIYGYDPVSNTVAPVTLSGNSFSSAPKYYPPTSWTGDSFDARAYDSVQVWVTVAPNTAANVLISPDNNTWINDTAIKNDFSTTTQIAITGTFKYTFSGRGYVKLSSNASATGATYFISAV